MAIEVSIEITVRGFAQNDEWRRAGSDKKLFPDIKAAREFIRDEYGKHKRAPMYVDGADGKPLKVGYVISRRNDEMDHRQGRLYHFIEQHWISFYNVDRVDPFGRAINPERVTL